MQIFQYLCTQRYLDMKNKGNEILITGARVHNLKNVDVRIPRDKLVVITGLSGSGKSSLAFDTIFAEGQRRYMETFSSYARGYIGTMQRPDVDKITGLSPVISIDQKTTSRNPRSTVGTVTEVYDYMRLLFARAADAYSYASGEKMVQYTDDQILDLILREYAGQKVLILAPMVNNRKGHYKELFETIRRKGFLHVRVDGEVQEIYSGMKLDRYKNHTIEVVVDRLKLGERREAKGEEANEDLKRLRQSVDQAMRMGDGVMAICAHSAQAIRREGERAPQKSADFSGTPQAIGDEIRYFSRHLMCPTTGMSYAEPAPHTFSFNSPQGWCPTCRGLGRVKGGDEAKRQLGDEELDNIIKDDDNWYTRILEYMQQPEDEKEEKEEVWCECPACHGQRLNREALSFRIADKNIAELSAMDITDLRAWLMIVPARLTNKQRAIAEPIIKEIISRLGFMLSVGLSYLSLSRSSDSLSGGENQRIRLATQVGSKLVNVLYILDEPSIGLHQRDNQRLIDSLKQLRDMGNSVIVVEHDEDMMRQADYVIDIGPKAGRLGGEIVFEGTPAELLKADTLTAKYLRGELSATLGAVRSLEDGSGTTYSLEAKGEITLRGCRGNNLKGVDVSFPLGKMIAVTGVSGSGKSTLVNQTLYPILSQHFYRSLQEPLAYDSIEGIEHIDKVIAVDQSPIGRTPRSNPATYTGVFTDIRNLFAQLPESKIRSWKPGRFSFNNAGGRCEECSGNGYKTIQMNFLPNVYVPCEVCGGKRYNRETLEARFKGKSIADVLDMTINQAVEFFESQPYILKKIKTLQNVGLGYIKLGQASTTLSGGESQRVKLATELARPSTGKTLYILDEPTTGLHFEDVRVLMGVLRQLVDKGNTVIIIEHNPDVIRSCDHLIDMGPDGGRDGGTVVATGTVEDIRNNEKSLTGRYI